MINCFVLVTKQLFCVDNVGRICKLINWLGLKVRFLTGSHPFNLTLSLSYSALLDVHKKVVEQRDQYAIECEQMRRSATPRYVHSFGQ